MDPVLEFILKVDVAVVAKIEPDKLEPWQLVSMSSGCCLKSTTGVTVGGPEASRNLELKGEILVAVLLLYSILDLRKVDNADDEAVTSCHISGDCEISFKTYRKDFTLMDKI